MVFFFRGTGGKVTAVESVKGLSGEDVRKLVWLLDGAEVVEKGLPALGGRFVGPRREMITPWSTNAVEITQNMGINGICRMEEFFPIYEEDACYDKMLQRLYDGLDVGVFTITHCPAPIVHVKDIGAYNRQEGLALSEEETAYLQEVSRRLNRPLTDSEVYGFAQVNSEHCRHKIFNGRFVIDGKEQAETLFGLIRQTSEKNGQDLVSAYKDNVAFKEGPEVELFAPLSADKPDYYTFKRVRTVLSLKAETHNFPTTVEPFNGASTGTGGEIRDRLAGGRASLPLAGTAVYMTAYPRTDPTRTWEQALEPRPWLYQTPQEILIKASNGASDFGNKFGQPLICGSLLTFEQEDGGRHYAYDKVIMLAGGVGYAQARDALKGEATEGDKILLFGGDNYRIGMGGGSVSSVNTGEYAGSIELNAVQRANPEMQRRVANVIRALAEADDNPIVSIHDHGAGGHLNCLSELVESTGGRIDLATLPVGDPTLSAREIIGNESQERMGVLIRAESLARIGRIAERERAPFYVVGEATGNKRLSFGEAFDLPLEYLFGKAPVTFMWDETRHIMRLPLTYDAGNLEEYIENVLQLEAVGCKDWLTNKVDRSVGGRTVRQQCVGVLQLPLSDYGAVALDFTGDSCIATSIGHAPQTALIDAAAGSTLAIAEALTNLVFAPLTGGLSGVSLSANWMWPCRNEGEDARLYVAVRAASEFAVALGINIPTGKDSLSMTQKYQDGEVLSPGTVIISAVAQTTSLAFAPTTQIRYSSPEDRQSPLYYVPFTTSPLHLGGSALAQTLAAVGDKAPEVEAGYFSVAFEVIQSAVRQELILAGHDVSAGGLITTLLEMCFPNPSGGIRIHPDRFTEESDLIRILFSEAPAVVVQVTDADAFERLLLEANLRFVRMGEPIEGDYIHLMLSPTFPKEYILPVGRLRSLWFRPSFLLDHLQTYGDLAAQRYAHFAAQPLEFTYPEGFMGTFDHYGLNPFRRTPTGLRAAVIREKGSQCERETAYALHLAGFDVRDVHTTDLVSGRETLEDVSLVVFAGGFSNSDVLGSAKGWAGALLYNPQARETIHRFYARPDTLSLGICNGCQLMAELNLLYPEHGQTHRLLHNRSRKFESAYVTLIIPENHSVFLHNLAGVKLGAWIAHGEGRFEFPLSLDEYHVAARYKYDAYPANPNGSPDAIAALSSHDGRHLAIMPHPERSLLTFQCPDYPFERRGETLTPWIIALLNARDWLTSHKESQVKLG
ncbi:MAG: phosphoribosylformylglycinamidine synthase [Tannerellaceae bacterium]|jgi:phosphoribosylformylglycinamidine synthase|nr:phosphoribosylformylglycinamidine synthase [Tannerellaceae bacterium]